MELDEQFERMNFVYFHTIKDSYIVDKCKDHYS